MLTSPLTLKLHATFFTFRLEQFPEMSCYLYQLNFDLTYRSVLRGSWRKIITPNPPKFTDIPIPHRLNVWQNALLKLQLYHFVLSGYIVQTNNINYDELIIVVVQWHSHYMFKGFLHCNYFLIPYKSSVITAVKHLSKIFKYARTP